MSRDKYFDVANPEFQGDVATDLAHDQPNLFSLADAVLEAAPRRNWASWVIDSRDGYYVGQFLSEVYRLSRQTIADPPPQVHILNSRSVRDLPEHQELVLQRLGEPDLSVAGNNVLIVTEYVQHGGCLERLMTPLRKLGAAGVDAAILSLDQPYGDPHKRQSPPDEMYMGSPETDVPRLVFGAIHASIGHVPAWRGAEPEDTRGFNRELREYTTTIFQDLAHQYTAAREPLNV